MLEDTSALFANESIKPLATHAPIRFLLFYPLTESFVAWITTPFT